MQDRIYVQIPAYRDGELLATIRDMVGTAADPNRLRIAIAWQYGEDEAHLEDQLRRCGDIELTKIPALESRGCNWARSLLQNRWNGERYTLFLDSHHRFVSDWDAEVIRILEERRTAGIAKPIVTGYLPPYDPGNDPQGRTASLFRIRRSMNGSGRCNASSEISHDSGPNRPMAAHPSRARLPQARRGSADLPGSWPRNRPMAVPSRARLPQARQGLADQPGSWPTNHPTAAHPSRVFLLPDRTPASCARTLGFFTGSFRSRRRHCWM